MLRQGELHQDTVDILVRIQPRDLGEECFLRGSGGQERFERGDSGLGAGGTFIAHIHLARRIFTNKNDREAGLEIKFSNRRRNLAAQFGGEGFAVDDFSGHAATPLVVEYSKW